MRAILTAISLLVALAPAPASAADKFTRPEAIRFGARTQQLETLLARHCARMRTRPINPPFLQNVRERQLQIDCEGMMFRGKPRHVEFVIRDDRLVMVWLTVDATESGDIMAAMARSYGIPTRRNRRYIAFERHGAAWRHEPPEILFYGPDLRSEVEAWFR